VGAAVTVVLTGIFVFSTLCVSVVNYSL